MLKAFDARESKILGVIGQVQRTLDRVDGTFANLQKTTTDAERLLAGTEKTGLVFQNLVQSVNQLATKFKSEEPFKPFDIKEYTEVLTKLQDTAQQLNNLVMAVDKTSSPLVTNILDQFDKAADKRVDHIFLRLVQLFAIITVMALIVVLIHNHLRRKVVRHSN